MTGQNIYAVVPAFNEESVVTSVIAGLRGQVSCVIVVDDGSTDATGAAAEAAGAFVLRHGINLGQGAALQTGIDYALLRGAEVVVTFDADGQHDPADIPQLLAALQAQGADVALGSRFLGNAIGMSKTRRCLIRAFTAFTRWQTGLKLTDTHNGLRALTRAAALRIRLRQNHMAHASELLNQVAALGLHYVEVPCTIRYTDYSLRKGQKLRNGLLIMCDLLLEKLR